MTLQDEIKAIEDEIRTTKYNKATQQHVGRLKAKLARLKEELIKRRTGGAGGANTGYSIRKAGDATVALVGFPSVGKSTLLNKLTNAESEVGAYDFTTLKVVPGIMDYEGARTQILDLPGMVYGASSGRGKGREIISVLRASDLILFLIDVFNIKQLETLKKELYDSGIRLDERPPEIKIKRKKTGGISVNSTLKLTKVNEEEVKAVLSEYKMHNTEVVFREDTTIDRFIDVLTKNRVYLPSIVALNKVDLVKEEYIKEATKHLKGRDYIPISADKDTNLEKLREAIYKKLKFIKIFMKPQGKKADFDEPMIVVVGATVGDVCDRMHREKKKSF
ncbi:GTP-binding protein, partial [archaeon]|nr:GTP-binding protein [archaeon]